MNVVAALCHRFPEAALVARRFLDKSSKRAAETKPRKGHAFDPTKLVHYLHETVGAPRDASPSTLKRADRARALRMHPDKSKAPDAEDRFRELQAAYDVLSDARERAAYDRETFFGAV